MNQFRSVTVLGFLLLAVVIPIVFAALSPLHQWRSAVYITASMAGVIGMSLLLIQPLLMAGMLSVVNPLQARKLHRYIGVALVASVIIHVAGLWITSPPDVIDALTFTSPTPFSAWGVIAMWAVFITAMIAAFRKQLGVRPKVWRLIHLGLAVIIVGGTIVHAVLIEGTMETISKITLCVLVGGATITLIANLYLGRGKRL